MTTMSARIGRYIFLFWPIILVTVDILRRERRVRPTRAARSAHASA